MLEYLAEVPADAVAEAAVPGLATHAEAVQRVGAAATATAAFYLANSAADGIPYWDTGAPGLAALGDWRTAAADPFNDHEPVDSSAAAIAAQGLLRLAMLPAAVLPPGSGRLLAAGLTVARTLFAEPYLATDPAHQGVLLHTIYHRPNGWDHIPQGRRIPCGESCQWGDYHALELALLIHRLAAGTTLPWAGGIANRPPRVAYDSQSPRGRQSAGYLGSESCCQVPMIAIRHRNSTDRPRPA